MNVNFVYMNSSIQKILVCLDGSKYSEKALNQAIKIAKKFKSKIFLIHVAEPHFVLSSLQPSMIEPFWGGINSTTIERSLKASRKAGGKIFEKNSKILKKEGIIHDKVLLLGNPSEEILKFAKKKKPDFIILGSHGKGKLERAFLGSVSTSISQKSNCSVIIAK